MFLMYYEYNQTMVDILVYSAQELRNCTLVGHEPLLSSKTCFTTTELVQGWEPMVKYFSLVYSNSTEVHITLKYIYSVISLRIDSLPVNTKNGFDPFWNRPVRGRPECDFCIFARSMMVYFGVSVWLDNGRYSLSICSWQWIWACTSNIDHPHNDNVWYFILVCILLFVRMVNVGFELSSRRWFTFVYQFTRLDEFFGAPWWIWGWSILVLHHQYTHEVVYGQ